PAALDAAGAPGWTAAAAVPARGSTGALPGVTPATRRAERWAGAARPSAPHGVALARRLARSAVRPRERCLRSPAAAAVGRRARRLAAARGRAGQPAAPWAPRAGRLRGARAPDAASPMRV